jgi:hypothetical protein
LRLAFFIIHYALFLYVILSGGRRKRRPKSNFCGLSVSEQAEARAVRRCGIWLEISVACLRDVTFSVESHPNSLPYPIVAFAPRFFLAPRSKKLRLRASHSAQNDRLIVRFAFIVRGEEHSMFCINIKTASRKFCGSLSLFQATLFMPPSGR